MAPPVALSSDCPTLIPIERRASPALPAAFAPIIDPATEPPAPMIGPINAVGIDASGISIFLAQTKTNLVVYRAVLEPALPVATVDPHPCIERKPQCEPVVLR